MNRNNVFIWTGGTIGLFMGASIVSLIEACFYVYKVRKHYLRGHVHMTSALRGREGITQFLTKEREVAWIWY